ncbi:hypothetical protein C1645_830666 [Glomus cerebriforme]|uniref:Protein kinase domain-containing protein n=1 Tax=Glomus cerebriforme TaxID=658196 RepID=A0A397SS68_9GLOM|nr:hypothetical protein C1645_830666 [Glomus cerebriforme]
MLLVQKNSGPHSKIINEAIRLFSGLVDLNYEPGYNDHIYFQYLSNNKNDISFLGAYHPEEIYSKYIIWVAGKNFIVVDHLSEVYGFPNTYKCIDRNLPLHLVLDIKTKQYSDSMNPELSSLDEYKISHEDLLFRILIVCTDIINSDLNYFIILDAFTLTSSFNANKCSWHVMYPYAHFIDYRNLEGFVKKVADRVEKLYSVFINFDLYKSRFSLHLFGLPKSNYSEIWPQIFFSKKSEKEEFQPIEDKTTLSVRAGLQKNYKPDHKGLVFRKVTEISAKPKRGIVKRIGDAISNPCSLVGLSEMMINVEKLKDTSEVYPDFLACLFVTILDEANAIMRQMSSSTNARESENAIRDVLRTARHVLAIDVFANVSILTFLQIYHGENICVVNNKYQPHIGETVEFIYNPNSEAEAIAVMAKALVEKASKLFKPDNSPVEAIELDYMAYTNTVEADISFEIIDHFDIVIAITNIVTPVHVEAFVQMFYRIYDSLIILFLYSIRKINELFRPLGCENIQAELANAQPNNLPTSIKSHSLVIKETDFNAIATFQNLDPEEAKNLKFTRVLYPRYLNIFICEIFMVVKIWIMRFGIIFAIKSYNEESTIKGLEAKDIMQWKDTYYKTRYNSEKSNHLCGLVKAIKTIKAIADNWYEYTIESDKKRIEPKGQQVRQYSYRINHQLYNSTGFGNKEKYNLMADFTPEQLSEHAPEFNALLPDWMVRRNEHFSLTPGGTNSSVRLLEFDSWRNEHFSSTPGGTNTSAQLMENELFDLIPGGNWGNEHFGSTPEGTNTLAQLLKINRVKGGNELFGSAPGGGTLSPSIIVLIEAKRKHVLEDMGEQTFSEFYNISKGKDVIQQIYNYMGGNELRYENPKSPKPQVLVPAHGDNNSCTFQSHSKSSSSSSLNNQAFNIFANQQSFSNTPVDQQNYSFMDFKFKSILGEGQSGKTLLCEFHNEIIALKSVNLSNVLLYILKEMQKEVKIYKDLSDIQGKYISKVNLL